jgi:hypothetical protein
MNTHGLVCDFGRHNGELYTRMPVQYLKWMVQSFHSKAEIAQAELSRRGTVTPDLDVSGHAIDSASLRLRKTWHETALSPNEGLHAWMVRMCQEALAQSQPDSEGAVYYRDIKFVFQAGAWPVLKTVMPRRNKNIESPDTSHQQSKGQNTGSPVGS